MEILPAIDDVSPLAGQSSSQAHLPPRARKRISQACERCRRKRDRCDGKKPRCSNCLRRDTVCVYDPIVKKRGLPEGYVRDLEIYTKDLETCLAFLIEGNARFDDQLFRKADSAANCKNQDIREVWNNGAASKSLRHIWQESRLFQELKKQHPFMESEDIQAAAKMRDSEGTQPSRSLENEPSAESTRPTDQQDSERLAAEVPVEDVLSGQNLSGGDPILLQPVAGVPEDFDVTGGSTSIWELPSGAFHLLNVYFTYTHCWLPIVQKHNVLKTCHQYSSKSSGPFQISGSHAVLWAALAIAQRQIENKELLRMTSSGSGSSNELYLRARRNIPTESGQFVLEHVQALLIMCLFNIGNGDEQSAWFLSGFAVRVALHLGLHESHLHTHAMGQRGKHVFLGCFVVDTLVSAKLGRKPHMETREIKIVGEHIEEDGMEEWDPWIDIFGTNSIKPSTTEPPLVLSTFNRLISVLKTLNQLTRNSSLGGELSQLSELSKADPILPPVSMNFPHHLNLHLIQLATKAILNTSRFQQDSSFYSTPHLSQHFTTIIQQMLQVLQSFRNSYGLSLVPPVFEVLVSAIHKMVEIVGSRASIIPMSSRSWKAELLTYVDEMQSVWPAFSTLRLALSQSIATYSNSDQPITIFNLSTNPSGSHGTSWLGDSTMSKNSSADRQVLVHGIRPVDMIENHNLHVASTLDRSISSNSMISEIPGHDEPGLDYMPIDSDVVALTTSSLPGIISCESESIQHTPSTNLSGRNQDQLETEVDRNLIFHEFATFDAMEWTEIYDQSLLNLGFTNTMKSDQAFNEYFDDLQTTDGPFMPEF